MSNQPPQYTDEQKKISQALGKRVSEWFENDGVKDKGYFSISLGEILILAPNGVSEDRLKEVFKTAPKLVKLKGGNLTGDVRL